MPLRVWAEALAEAYERGLARGVGFCNLNEAQLEAAKAVLDRHRVPLLALQVEYSLLRREAEAPLPALRREGIALTAYSPLAMGWLTGKLDPKNPPRDYRGRKYRQDLPRLPRLLGELRALAGAKGVPVGAVALRYLVEKGALPIPGAKNEAQARMNAEALAFRLSPEEVARLEAAS